MYPDLPNKPKDVVLDLDDFQFTLNKDGKVGDFSLGYLFYLKSKFPKFKVTVFEKKYVVKYKDYLKREGLDKDMLQECGWCGEAINANEPVVTFDGGHGRIETRSGPRLAARPCGSASAAATASGRRASSRSSATSSAC